MGKVLIIKDADFSLVALDKVTINSDVVINISDNGVVTINAPYAKNIYYTIDGNNPTITSTKYTSEFTVTDGTTVKAIAEYTNGVISKVALKTYSKKEISIIKLKSGVTRKEDISDGSINIREDRIAIGIPVSEGKIVSLKVSAGYAVGGYIHINQKLTDLLNYDRDSMQISFDNEPWAWHDGETTVTSSIAETNCKMFLINISKGTNHNEVFTESEFANVLTNIVNVTIF